MTRETIAIIIAWAFIRAANPEFTVEDFNDYKLETPINYKPVVIKQLNSKGVNIELGVSDHPSGGTYCAIKINPTFH